MGKMKKIKRGFVTLLAAVVAATSLVPAVAEDTAADAGTIDWFISRQRISVRKPQTEHGTAEFGRHSL